jgi:hypothetical protein
MPKCSSASSTAAIVPSSARFASEDWSAVHASPVPSASPARRRASFASRHSGCTTQSRAGDVRRLAAVVPSSAANWQSELRAPAATAESENSLYGIHYSV